jgi:hypothetical protein
MFITALLCGVTLGALRHLLTSPDKCRFLTLDLPYRFYMGLEPALLKRHFGRGLSAAEKLFACTAFHHFSDPLPPTDPFDTTSFRVLEAVSNRPPSNKDVMYHCEVSRALLGDGLADRLALPRATTLTTCLRVRFNFLTGRALVEFGRMWRRGWNLERQAIFRKTLPMIVAWQMGERRVRCCPTRFQFQFEPPNWFRADKVCGQGEGGSSQVHG